MYIGNTRYGFGGVTSDLIKEIIENMKNGDTVGIAHLKMKQEKLNKNTKTDWDKAVTYELALYGDPTLKIEI